MKCNDGGTVGASVNSSRVEQVVECVEVLSVDRCCANQCFVLGGDRKAARTLGNHPRSHVAGKSREVTSYPEPLPNRERHCLHNGHMLQVLTRTGTDTPDSVPVRVCSSSCQACSNIHHY